MEENVICRECILGKKKTIVGDGINEPPYVGVVKCPFDNIYYKNPDDECSYIEEYKQAFVGMGL